MENKRILARKFPKKISKVAQRLISGRPLKEKQLSWALVLLARPLVQRYKCEQQKREREGKPFDYQGEIFAENGWIFRRLRTEGNFLGHGLQHSGELMEAPFWLKLSPEVIVEAIEEMEEYFDEDDDGLFDFDGV